MKVAVPSRRSVGVVCLAIAAMLAGCVDEDPVGDSRRTDAVLAAFSVSTLPDERIFEDEAMLEIARSMPTFGGFYYNDSGDVEVLLTDVSALPEADLRVRPLLGSYRAASARLVARRVDYTFLELARYRTVLRQTIFEIPGVVSLGVRESANKVKVGIEDRSAESDVFDLMSALGVPVDAVMFVPEARGSDLVLRGAAANVGMLTVTLQDQHPGGLLQGGWEIRSSGGTCTLGFPALRGADALPVFVTNSHCTAVRTFPDGVSFTQPSGPQVGHEILDPLAYACGSGDECRHSDSAMIQADGTIDLGRIARTTQASPVGCEHCVESLVIDASQPTFVIGDRIDHVIENETLNKIGRTTGWTRGNVEDTCDDYESEIANSGDPCVKQCSDRVDLNVDPGDSGSPVFSIAGDGTVELRGLVFSEQGCCLGYHDMWMSDLNQIENDLGPLTVFDPGAPSINIVGPSEVTPNVYCTWTGSVTNGVPPFSYQWGGLFAGTGPSIDGYVGTTGGTLTVQVTDGFGRQAFDAVVISVEGDPGPILCE